MDIVLIILLLAFKIGGFHAHKLENIFSQKL